MTTTAHLSPAAARIAALAEGTDDEQLSAPTPCAEFAVRDLLAHLVELTVAFRAAATKTSMSGQGDPGHGGVGLNAWRARLPAELDGLVTAWRDPAAWEGMTEVGGISLPGAMAGGFARNELVLHGWDLAAATGRPFDLDPATLETCLSFTAEIVDQGFDAYGPPVSVDDAAPPLDRLLGLAGRDPSWTAPTAADERRDAVRTADRPAERAR